MYNAVVSRITTSPHPDPEVHSLQLAHALGYTIIVGKDAQAGALYVIFADDGKLSPEYAKANNLYPIKDENGKKIGGGYFTEGKERVKAQRFRGVKSEAFAMPVESLAFTGYNIADLKEGDQFDTLNDVKICEKYFTPATLRAMKNQQGQPKKKPVEFVFPEHKETTQWRYAFPKENTLLHITAKLHGTSVRVVNTKVTRPLNLWQKITKKLFNVDHSKPEYILGSRRVALKIGDTNKNGGYYAHEKGDVAQPYVIALQELQGKLKEDVQVYGELVGYLPTGKCLFTHATAVDKELVKRYGKVMDYSYGNPKGQASFYVYRVTDRGRDLSWFEVMAFCEAHGVKHVPHIKTLYLDEDFNREELNEYIESLLEGPSVLDDSHIEEGVCILMENKEGSKIYKSKSFSFRLCEGLIKDSADYVDMEEVG